MTGTRTIGYLPSFADDRFMGAIRQVPGARRVHLEDLAALRRHVPDLEAIVTGGNESSYSRAVAEELAGRAHGLRWIQVTSAGHDALARFGVPRSVQLTGNGGAFNAPVAEHAMALLLALSRRLPLAMHSQSRPHWDRGRLGAAISLDGCTLAVIGFGGIGREVARRARAFGLHVIGVSRSGRPCAEAYETLAVTALHEALARADAVVLSTPLTPDTLHLMNGTTLAACRPGALLVNVGRGKLVDTAALVDALHSGQIGGAGLDVTDPEPLPDDHPLWTLPNVIVTPHMAPAGAPQAVEQIAALVAENTRRFVKGLPLQAAFSLSLWIGMQL